MAGVKGRSGGARPGAGRPRKTPAIQHVAVECQSQRHPRRKFASEEERAAARKERVRAKYAAQAAEIIAKREAEKKAACEAAGTEYKKYARRTAHECVCQQCGAGFTAVLASAKYCGQVCKNRANNTSDCAQERRRSDELFRLKGRFRSLLRSSLRRRGYSKRSKTQEVLGCDWETFRSHIERQFQPGMTWEKMGPEIHIDHIIPLASATSYEDLVRLNHFTNLRPLWAVDNMRKGARLMSLV